MPRRATAPRIEDGRAGWPQLVAAYVEATRRLLVCGLAGGRVLRVPMAKLGLPRGFDPVIAAPDEFRAGLLLVGNDGRKASVAVDFLLYLTDASYRAQFDSGADRRLGQRVATRLRAIRLRMGLSQRAVAERLGMAPPNYARLEAGRHMPSVTTLLRVAEQFNLPLGALVGR